MRVIKVKNCSECPYTTEAMTCELTGTDVDTENYYSNVMSDCPLDELKT